MGNSSQQYITGNPDAECIGVRHSGAKRSIDFKKVARLVRKAQQGNVRAFDELYALYFSQVYYTMLRYMRNLEDANEATQEVFVKVYRNLGSLDNAMLFHSWINRIAHNYALDVLDRNKRRGKYVVFEHELTDGEASSFSTDGIVEENEEFIPQAYLENEEHRQEIMGFVDQLKEDQKSAVLMYYYNGLSVPEISEMTQDSESAIRKRLFRARTFIKESIATTVGDRTVLEGALAAAPVPVLSSIMLKNAQESIPAGAQEAIHTNVLGKLGLLGVPTGGAPLPSSVISAASANANSVGKIVATAAAVTILGAASVAFVATRPPQTGALPTPSTTAAVYRAADDLSTQITVLVPASEETTTTSAALATQQKQATEQTPQAVPSASQEDPRESAPEPAQSAPSLGTPLLHAANSSLTYREGTHRTEQELLEDAGVRAYDTLGRKIPITTYGYEAIDFDTAGSYELLIKAVDSEGNKTAPVEIAIHITP